MANSNIATGLRAIGKNGGVYDGKTQLCAVPAAQSGNIFLGDPVVALGGTDAYGVPLVGIAGQSRTMVSPNGKILMERAVDNGDGTATVQWDAVN